MSTYRLRSHSPKPLAWGSKRAWYATHPGWVDAGLARHADTLELLGL